MVPPYYSTLINPLMHMSTWHWCTWERNEHTAQSFLKTTELCLHCPSANSSWILFMSVWSSILNVPGESTLRRDFLRLQQENKERSEALKRQQAQLAAQRRDPEEHKRQLLHDRQKRIEEQKEQRRRLEEVHMLTRAHWRNQTWSLFSQEMTRAECQSWKVSV